MSLWDEKPLREGYPRPHYQQRAKFYYYPEVGMDSWLEKVKVELDKLEAIKNALNENYVKSEDVPCPMMGHFNKLYNSIDEILEAKCPECGGPATHPSGLCRGCHQGKMEAEDP